MPLQFFVRQQTVKQRQQRQVYFYRLSVSEIIIAIQCLIII